MATATFPLARSATLSTRLGRSLGASPALALAGLGLLLITLASAASLLLDPREILGQPAWLKPAKFAFSFAVYAFTFLWLLGFVRGHPRLVRVVGVLTGAGVFLEGFAVALQVARGTTSHFNFATPFDGALFGLMGMSILVVWVLGALVALLLLRQRLPDAPLAWGLRLGLLVTLLGMLVAVPMTLETPLQAADRRAGLGVNVQGAHAVGVPDGGPGLPIVGWSTTGGDLRVGHFVGLHALQVLPLLGWVLAQRGPRRLSERRRAALVGVAAAALAALTLLLTWQALRGQPLVAPDGLTLAALGSLLAATAGLVAAVFAWPRVARSPSTTA